MFLNGPNALRIAIVQLLPLSQSAAKTRQTSNNPNLVHMQLRVTHASSFPSSLGHATTMSLQQAWHDAHPLGHSGNRRLVQLELHSSIHTFVVGKQSLAISLVRVFLSFLTFRLARVS